MLHTWMAGAGRQAAQSTQPSPALTCSPRMPRGWGPQGGAQTGRRTCPVCLKHSNTGHVPSTTTCMHTHKHTHTHIHIHARMLMWTRIDMHTHTYLQMITHMPAHNHAHSAHTCTLTRIHIQTYTCSNSHIFTHAHTHMCSYTQLWASQVALGAVGHNSIYFR